MERDTIIQTLRANRALLDHFGVRSLSIFGSFARGEANSESDIDILVEFEPGADVGLFEFIMLKGALSNLLGIPVDLVTPAALHPALKDDILLEALRVA